MNKKKIGILVAVVVLLVVVVAAGFGITKLVTKEKPQDTLVEFVEALKNGDFEKATNLAADGTMGTLDIEEEDTESLEMMKLYFKNLSINVDNVSAKKEEATITATISNKDLGNIIELYINKALEIAKANIANPSSDTTASQEELMTYFKSLFDSDEVENVSNSVEVQLVKVDGQWRVVVDEKVRDAILPGLAELSQTPQEGK